jgi:Na+-transporting NADH:ubiquinone oxidoreductase subunit F
MLEIILGVAAFTVIVLLLTLFVLGARRLLVPSGECSIRINGKITLTASIGQRLLEVLTSAGMQLPAACSGSGICGLCKVRVTEGGGEPRPVESALLMRKDIASGVRLACQVPIFNSMNVEVDEVYFAVKTWQCKVLSVRHVATLIREIVLELPVQESCEFRPGSFVQVVCPPYSLTYTDFNIDQAYRTEWDKSKLWSCRVSSASTVTRAYSVANRPEDDRVVRLNVRIALPPLNNRAISPGIVSSWLFSLQPGDEVEVNGPYGLFFVEPGDKEAIFVGGGVGMAPLYAQIMDLLKAQHSKRKISYWYGARSERELYYADEFEQIQSEYDNFSWNVALSEPESNDDWQGHTGFIHRVLYEAYLEAHPAPEECAYYLCGPPMMIKAVLAMLDNIGVDPDAIHFDDFGGAGR